MHSRVNKAQLFDQETEKGEPLRNRKHWRDHREGGALGISYMKLFMTSWAHSKLLMHVSGPEEHTIVYEKWTPG